MVHDRDNYTVQAGVTSRTSYDGAAGSRNQTEILCESVLRSLHNTKFTETLCPQC
jgi:hypothetical protein